MIKLKTKNKFVPSVRTGGELRLGMLVFLGLLGLSFSLACAADSPAAKPAETPAGAAGTNANATVKTNASPHFAVRGYEIHGDTLLSTETLRSILAKHTGPNASLTQIMRAASELHMAYRALRCPT